MKHKKIILGVTQFGLHYGIFNKFNLDKKKELKKVLNFAKKKKIKSLYTSKYYGNANKFLASENLKGFKIFVKFKCRDLININFIKNFDKIKNELRNNDLTLMLDGFENCNSKLRAKIYNFLLDLREKKIINKFGYSIYSFKNLKKICDKFKPSILQCPYNVFDRRLEEKKLLQFLKINKIEIHVRSIFLQGLLIPHYSKLPKKFLKWKKILKKFNEQMHKYKASNIFGCLNFIEQNKYIDKVLVGVDNVKQLKEICNFNYNKTIKFPDFKIKNEKLINPSKW